MQQQARLATGSSSESFKVSGLEGGKQSLEKSVTWGRDKATCVDGQLDGVIRVFSGSPEQVMSVDAEQVTSGLGSCEKSRASLSSVTSVEHRGSCSHGPKGLISRAPNGPSSQSPKGFIAQRSPSNENDSPLKKCASSAVQVGVIFQAKTNEKGKQILGKGNLKKVAQAKGKASDDQTLAQLMEIGTKRLRGKEASEEENNRAHKRFCKTINSGLVVSVLEPV
nr:hypothetical protein CFP56_34311 [Quercus suber]